MKIIDIKDKVSREAYDMIEEFNEAVEYADDLEALQDAVHELADAQVDIYNYDLIEWLKRDGHDAVWEIEEAMDEFGVAKDSDGKPDFYGLIRQGQYHYYSKLFYELFNAYEEAMQ